MVKAGWDKSNDIIIINLMIAKFKERHDVAIQLITKQQME